jgi:hypothetical protein
MMVFFTGKGPVSTPLRSEYSRGTSQSSGCPWCRRMAPNSTATWCDRNIPDEAMKDSRGLVLHNQLEDPLMSDSSGR